VLRPFFPYYGSKWSLAKHYPSPAHETVIEPFAGSAGYSTFHHVQKAILVDADPIIVGVWSYLISVSEEEILSLPELPLVGDSVDDHTIPEEAKWLIGFWLNRGSASPKKSRTAYSARSDKAQLNWGPKAKQRIAEQISFIREWTVSLGSFETAPEIQATWHVDPPYKEKGKYYRMRFDDYERLASWCLTRTGQLIVCEGPNADWLPFRELGDFKTSKGKSKEYAFVRNHNDKGIASLAS